MELADIEAAAQHGRAALTELFRLQSTAADAARRDAAGRALAVIWARDELIAEEEKAIVRRGFDVAWSARKRYPRALQTPISVAISYGVPFLREDGDGVKRSNLEWSHRIEGSGRASLEAFTPPKTSAGRAEFTIVPTDFVTNGPHRLVLVARAATVGLTETWELELPHMPFSFEFDPILAIDALLALPDQARAERFAGAVQLVPGSSSEASEAAFLTLNADWVLRSAPWLEVKTPLPCDLAHRVEIEIEGIDGWHPADSVVVSGQGTGTSNKPEIMQFELGPFDQPIAGALDRPGPRRLRARLIASPELGWANADVRSLWPGTIETGWIEVEVVRR